MLIIDVEKLAGDFEKTSIASVLCSETVVELILEKLTTKSVLRK
jgi:hypothetical protein